jgi:ubiquinone/menaquinone biosynthesis C-methylase UbiE
MNQLTESRKEFLPAAGRDVFLPLYDPLVSLMGGDRARQELIKQSSIQPNQRVLDIGCGTGTLVVLLKRKYATAHIVGLDPDPKALRRAKKKVRRAGVTVQLDQGFADELPYEKSTFDRVLSSFMFHHLEDQDREKMLREVLRVLRPGGSFHLLDFAGGEDGSHGHWGRLVNSHARLKDNSQERILQLMSRAGFVNAAKVKEGSMLFGLLRTAYYKAEPDDR